MKIDVLVLDDRQLSRFALTALLERREEIRVIGSVGSNLDALEFAEINRPNVVVVSFEGAGSDTIAIAEKIASVPGCRTLLLANAFSRSVVRRAFTGGVDGMVERSVPPRRFFEVIHQVHQGERVFDAELTVAALNNGGCPLTLRELSVLEHVARGDTVIEIAARLYLSEGTIRNYLSSVVAKLDARNRIDALRIAQNSHWI